MSDNPTLVFASLDEQKLKDSINSLVTHVDGEMKKMLNSTNATIDAMEKKIKELSNLKLNDSSTNNSTSSNSTKSKEEEIKAREKNISTKERERKAEKELQVTMDETFRLMRQATGNAPEIRTPDLAKSARESFMALFSNNKELIAQLGRQIQEVEHKLPSLYEKLHKAKKELRDSYQLVKEASLSGGDTKGLSESERKRREHIQENINALKQQISLLEKLGSVETLRSERERVAGLLRDEGNLQKQNAQSQKQETAAVDERISKQDALNKKIKEEAELIRREMAESGKTAIAYNGHAFYQEGKQPISKRVVPSIEEQLLKYYQEEAELKAKVAVGTTETAAATNQQATAESVVTEQLQQQLTTEQAISQERKSRVKTQSSEPTVQSLIESKTGEKAMSWTYGDSVNKLTDALRQYQSAYANMTEQERRSPLGKQAVDEMQELERHLHKVKQEMSRPVSFEAAMRLPTSSIDDLMFKIQMLEKYKRGLNFDTQGQDIIRTDEAIKSLNKDLDKYMSKSDSVLKKNTALGRSWNYMKNRLAFYFTVGASTRFIKQLADVRSQYELNEKALGVLVNSAAKGTKIFNQLSNMSLISPYTLIELSSAAKQLVAFNIAGNDVVETTRRLADMASAVGAPIERLTYALGQVKAYGYLNSRDARMFANTGIPLVQELANRYTELRGRIVSTAEVYDMMKKKAISYADVMGVVNKMTDEGGKFFNFQAKMADTLKVKLANFNLAYNNMLNDMGRDNQGTFDGLLKAGRSLMENWRQIYRILSSVIVTFGVVKAASAISTALSSVGFATLRNQITSTTTAAAGLKAVISSIPVVGWIGMLTSLASYFIFFNNSADELKQKLKVIADSFNDMRKQIDDAFVAATSTDNFGTQLAKLKEMVDSAKNDLGIVIPIKFEEINEKNIKQKLNEVRDFVYKNINFAQLASETAAKTELSEGVKEYGNIAQKVYTEATENINTLIAAMTKLNKEGRYTQDIDFLKGLKDNKENKSKLELLEELNKYLLQNRYIFSQNDLEQGVKGVYALKGALEELGVKNKDVFFNLKEDYNTYVQQTTKAEDAANKFFQELQKQVDIKNMPIKDRQIRIETFINTRGADEGWNDFTKQFIKKTANQKFGIHIKLDERSKEDVKVELEDWQKSLQDWCNKHGINLTATINFKEGDTPASVADQALQKFKEAKHNLDVALNKAARGSGTLAEVTAAQTAFNDAKKLAYATGVDKEDLEDKKKKTAADKARKQAESELQKALKDEISLADKARSQYEKLAKAGVDKTTALNLVTNQFANSIAHINSVLAKRGVPKFNLMNFAGTEDPKAMLEMYEKQLAALKKNKLVKPSEIKELELKISELKVDAKTFDFSDLTKKLDEQMENFSKEYELSLSIDEDVETGELFADMLGLNTETLPKTAKQYTDGLTDLVNKYLASTDSKLQLETVSLTKDDLSSLREMVKAGELTQVAYDKIRVASEKSADAEKKEIKERAKGWNELLEKYSEYEYKRSDIAKKANKERLNLIRQFGTQDQANQADIIIKQIDLATDDETKNRLKEQLDSLISDVTKDDETKARIAVSIDTKEKQETAKVNFEEYKNGADWLAAMEDAAKLSDEALKRISKDLRDIIETKQELTPTELKEINNVLDKMDEELTKRNPFTTLSDKLKNLKKSRENLKKAKDDKKKADDDVEEAKKSGNHYQMQKAIQKQKKAEDNLTDANNNYNRSVSESAQAMRDSIESSEQMWNSMDNLQSLLGDTAKEAISAGFGIASGMTTAWEAIKNGERSTAILAIVQMALQAINFLTGVLGGKKDTFTPMKEQVENLASVIDKVSESQKKMLDNSVGVVAMKKYKQLLENNETIINSYRDLARAAGESGSSAGSHSYAYRTNKALADSWGKISKAAGQSITKVQDLYDLAPEKLKQVMELAPKEWAMMDEDIRTSLEKVIEYGDKAVEYAEAVKTALTNLSLDNLTDDFEDMLADMENDAKSFSDNVSEYFRKAIVRSMVKDTFSEELKNWYEDFQNSMQDGDLSKDEADELRRQYMDIVNEALKKREQLFSVVGGNEADLSALQQGIQGVSEETASSIEAYMNSISQQGYLRNDLLTQIRDILGGFDMDAQLGVQGEMLLQLQQSYQTQQAIQSILEGWNNSSGRAVRVELIS